VRLEQASALRELTDEFDVPLIINDNVMLAQGVAADGVHLGGSDGSLAGARAVLGSGKLIGMSCYNRLALAHEAQSRGADYVAFGSFFASTVKPDAAEATPDLLRQARREIFVPLVAIGGITLHNGSQLLEAGADALAVISAVFSAKDIQGAAGQFANL
jgi:thiamine-phosphate pyrophosphorylase